MTEESYDQNLKQLNNYSNKISKQNKKYPFDNYQHKKQKTHVYNINKSDFRGLVQQLTGPSSYYYYYSQVHHPLPSPPPPIHNPKPQSSRLYSIRPPPLTTNTPVLSSATTITTIKDEENRQQVSSALSPLPAFPSVNFTAESPISAYMRYLRSTTPTTNTTTSDFESSKGQSDFLNTSFLSSSLFTPTTAAQLEFPQVPPTTLAPSWKNV